MFSMPRVCPLVADLEVAGIQMPGVTSDRHKLVQNVVRHAPVLVMCDKPQPTVAEHTHIIFDAGSGFAPGYLI